MNKHILKRLAILPVLVLLVLLVASPAWAADLRGGDAVIISSGDVIDDDLYLAATDITINGTVNGDVLCIGGTIEVGGTINGSLTALAPTIGIGGEVTHSVRLAGGDIHINGKIGGDLMTAGNDVAVSKSALIGRDLYFTARKMQIDALIDNHLKGTGTSVLLSSEVGGNAEIGAETLTLTPTANIQGSLTYLSQNEAVIQTGAHVGGEISHQIPKSQDWSFPNIGVWGTIIGFLMTFVTGSIIILIAPKRATTVASMLKRRPWLSLGWGAIVLIAAPIAIAIIMITIIGIPVGLIGIVTYIIALYLSQIVVGLFLGYWILGTFSPVNSRGRLIGAFVIGLIILTVAGLIPYIGIPICLASALFGLGAMALSLRNRSDATLVEVTGTPAQ